MHNRNDIKNSKPPALTYARSYVIDHVERAGGRNAAKEKKSFYAYDANGQVMATYTVTNTATIKQAQVDEHVIYGNGRLGLVQEDAQTFVFNNQVTLPNEGPYWTQKTGKKNYELTNYLGNVNAVITDRKVLDPTNPVFKAVVVATTDYYAFGMAMPGRQTNAGSYRFGYNGMEIDKEMSGNGNSYTTEFRQYDPRLGRWKSLDPLMAQFPWQSPYCAFDNNPVFYTDPLGLSTQDWIGKKKEDGNTYWEWDPNVTDPSQLPEGYTEYAKPGTIGTSPDGYKFQFCDNGVIRKQGFSDGVEIISPKNNSPNTIDLTQNSQGFEPNPTVEETKASPVVAELYIQTSATDQWIRNLHADINFQITNRSLNQLGMGAMAMLAAPFVVETAPLLGYSSKLWAVKGLVSAGSQALINDGDINLIGVGTDAFLGYGASSMIQSSFNYKFNILSRKTEFKSVFHSGKNNISIQQMTFQTSVGIVFGYKSKFVTNGYYKAFGAGAPTFGRAVGREFYGSSLYALPSNALNKWYEETH